MGLIQDEKFASEKYKLATEEINYNDKQVKIVQLTSDNVAKVEAMISTDSDYKDSGDINKKITYKKDETFIKHIGSSAYWLSQLKEIIKTENEKSKEGFSYEKIMEYLIASIDNENSTHLNSDKIGRNAVKKRLLRLKGTELKEYLKNPGDTYELIEIIQKPQEKGEKHHLSFATKFCHYASLFLFKGTESEDNFSIYDNVLKEALPNYIKRYLGKDVKLKEYENKYDKYIKFIDDIRNEASKEYKEKISRNGFDHLLWYYHKGRK